MKYWIKSLIISIRILGQPHLKFSHIWGLSPTTVMSCLFPISLKILMMKMVCLSSLQNYSRSFRHILKDSIVKNRKNKWDQELRLIWASGIDVFFKAIINAWIMSGLLGLKESLTIGWRKKKCNEKFQSKRFHSILSVLSSAFSSKRKLLRALCLKGKTQCFMVDSYRMSKCIWWTRSVSRVSLPLNCCKVRILGSTTMTSWRNF